MAQKKTLIVHSKDNYMMRMPIHESNEAMKELNPKAYQLLVYYYSKYSGWNFNDDDIAISINVPNERAVKKYKKELIDKEYLWITGKYPTVYSIGKVAVSDFKK